MKHIKKAEDDDGDESFKDLIVDGIKLRGSVHGPGEANVEIDTLVVPRSLLPSDLENLDVESVIHDEIDVAGSTHKRGRASISVDNLIIFDTASIEALSGANTNIPLSEVVSEALEFKRQEQ